MKPNMSMANRQSSFVLVSDLACGRYLGWCILFFSRKAVNLELTNCWGGGVCPKTPEKQLILMMSLTNCVPPPPG